MINLVIPTNAPPLTLTTHGDIDIYGAATKHVVTPLEYWPNPDQVVFLSLFHPNTMTALAGAGIDSGKLLSDNPTCPYTLRSYYPVVPMAIITKPENRESYTKRAKLTHAKAPGFHEMIHHDRVRHAADSNSRRKLARVWPRSNITTALMGTGYTQGCMINDGHATATLCGILLDNSDWLMCHTWVWFNK